MMPDQEPPSSRGSQSGSDGAEGVVDMTSRRAARELAEGAGEDSGPEQAVPTDETVVDLRPAVVGRDVTVERRSPEVVARPATPVAAEPDRQAAPAPTSRLSSRVVRTVAPVAVVLLVTAIVTTSLFVLAVYSQRDATRWSAVGAAELARSTSMDRAWAAVLAEVAAGVGQRVGDADVRELLGDVDGDSSVGSVADELPELAEADRTRSEFVDDVSSALARSGDSPVELGNELSALETTRSTAATASTAAVRGADELADGAAARATTSVRLALVVLVIGVAIAAAAGELSRRRLRRGLDRAVHDLDRAVARLGVERTPDPVVPRGVPELAWAVAELERRSAAVRARLGELRRRAEWGEQGRRLVEALELAEDEPSTYAVLGHALGEVGGGAPVELLLAERGSTSLRQVASNPTVPAPGCPVDTTASCVALRRGQVSVFDSSGSINACPKLRDRPSGPCSAACVPVTVAGRPVGVVHMTGPDHQPPSPGEIEQLVGLATQTGTRFSALRALESSRHEASTDGLTGLPNRRTLETQVGELFDRDTPFVLVLADLDRFKLLNDNFGHEAGDRALQLFAGVLRDNVRGNDVVARLGGEEFVLVYPNMSVEISLEAIERVRAALARELQGSSVPPFTCSFGIAHSTAGHDGDAVLRVADAGLLQAKDLGGDQAVVADADLAATIFADDAPLRARRDDRA